MSHTVVLEAVGASAQGWVHELRAALQASGHIVRVLGNRPDGDVVGLASDGDVVHLALRVEVVDWRSRPAARVEAPAAVSPTSLMLARTVHTALMRECDDLGLTRGARGGTHSTGASCGVYLVLPRHGAGGARVLRALADAVDAVPEAVRSADRHDPPREWRLVQHEEHSRFDIWHQVPLVPQVTGMNCWAAAAAMIIGWRDQIPLDAEHIVGGGLPLDTHAWGLEPDDVTALADAWGLHIEPPRVYTVDQLRELLERHGPLWVGQADPDLHVIVITGIYGDGAPDMTWVRINDPWPIGLGRRFRITFRELMDRFDAASRIAGVHARVLHVGGRRGASGAFSFERSSSAAYSWEYGGGYEI